LCVKNVATGLLFLSKNRQWVVLSLLLLAIGALIFTYKMLWLGYPPLPDLESEVWTVQVRLEVEPEGGPVRMGLMLPSRSRGYTLSNENFISRGFGLTVDEELFRRRADWAIRNLPESKTLYYRATLIPATRARRFAQKPAQAEPPQLEEPYASALADIIEEVQAESADTESFAASILARINGAGNDENTGLFLSELDSPLDKIRLAQTLLAGAAIPTLQVHGVMLQADAQRAPLRTLLAVYDGDDWLVFDPRSGHQGLPADFMIWWRGNEELAVVSGARLQDVQISIKRRNESALDMATQRAQLENSRIAKISVLQLPVQTQNVYELLLLVPIGILVIVILRNFVGFSSFGTFAPVLIALAFRETELFKGILLFTLIVSLGLFFRFYLERLRLLLVPRLAAVVTIVVLLMTTISIISHQLGVETGLSVSLFPMVIISMVIERMSVVWEERGASTSIREGLGSLLMAALTYLVISLDILAYWVSVFPELNLVVLGIIIALGRYTGFRLTELIRFGSLGGHRS
jgi:hypothetical protein